MKKIIVFSIVAFVVIINAADFIEDHNSIQSYIADVEDTITRDCSFSIQQITQFNIPFTITNPGLYCLAPNTASISSSQTGRLVVSSGTGITINTSNVIIDFNDTILEGQGGATGILIVNGSQNIIIRNGTVRTMTNAGITFNNTVNLQSGPIILSNITFMNNNLGLNTANPFNLIANNLRAYFSANTGFFINQATNCLFSNCISNNNSVNGFTVQNSNDVTFLSCLAESNSNNGFNIVGVSASQLINCIASRNKIGFLQVDGTMISQDNIFKNCIAEQNNNNGFAIKLQQSVLTSCISSLNAAGFQLNGSNNIISNSVANDNSTTGFYIIGTTNQNNQFEHCQALNNGSHGFQTTGNFHRFLDCVSKNNSGNGFVLTGTGTALENSHIVNNGVNGISINGYAHVILSNIIENHRTTASTITSAGILLAVNGTFGNIASFNAIRNNSLLNNTVGINNQGISNKIYSNFANTNITNYIGVPNVAVSPTIATPINFTANISE